jgi:hypothetical protein
MIIPDFGGIKIEEDILLSIYKVTFLNILNSLPLLSKTGENQRRQGNGADIYLILSTICIPLFL